MLPCRAWHPRLKHSTVRGAGHARDDAESFLLLMGTIHEIRQVFCGIMRLKTPKEFPCWSSLEQKVILGGKWVTDYIDTNANKEEEMVSTSPKIPFKDHNCHRSV